MARAGTLPDYLYQQEVQVGGKVSFQSTSLLYRDNHTNRNFKVLQNEANRIKKAWLLRMASTVYETEISFGAGSSH